MPLASIRAVALAAGVSKSTASLALRNHPSVAEATREQVKAVAAKLGYRVNPMVSALMTQQRMGHSAEGAPVIMLVDLYGAPDRPAAKEKRAPVSASALAHLSISRSAAEEAARFYGYRLDAVSARTAGMTPGRLRQIVAARGSRAVLLLMPPAPEVPASWMLDWSDCCVVQLGAPDAVYHHVRPNIIGTVQVALAELERRGYRRPGLNIPPANDVYSGHRWQMAFRQYYVQQGRPGLADALTLVDSDEKVVERWLDKAKPDAVVGMGEFTLKQIEATGRRVPEDVGFISLSLLPDEAGRLAGMDLGYGVRFRAAVQLLDSMLRHNESGRPESPLAMTVKGRWADGPTVRPVQA